MADIKRDTDLFQHRLNMMIYGPPPTEEVKATDEWDHLRVSQHPDVSGYYYRGQKGLRVHKTHIVVRHQEYEWIPDTEAIQQLRALMEQWRIDGKDELADAVETREESDGDETTAESIYESLGRSRTITSHVRVPIEHVKFYRTLPYDRAAGLRGIINMEPRKNAHIVGL